MILLIIIGIILAAYGGLSLKFPKQLKKSHQETSHKTKKYFSWYVSIYVLGAVVSLIIGILLIIAGVVLYW